MLAWRFTRRCCRPRGGMDPAPHDIAFYLRDLAGAFHSYYASRTLPGRRPGAGARIRRCWRHAPGAAQRAGGAGRVAPRNRTASPSPAAGDRHEIATRRFRALGLIVGLLVGWRWRWRWRCTSPRCRCPSSTRCRSAPPSRTRRGREEQELGPERRLGKNAALAPMAPAGSAPAVAAPRRRRPRAMGAPRPKRRPRPRPRRDPAAILGREGPSTDAGGRSVFRAGRRLRPPRTTPSSSARCSAMMGVRAPRSSEREQSGRTVYRVRSARRRARRADDVRTRPAAERRGSALVRVQK